MLTRARLGIAAALVVLAALVTAIGWWELRETSRWTLQVTNQRDAQILVAGVRAGDGITEGYSVIDPRTSAAAVVGHDNKPPDSIIIDFESHNGPDGELIVVPDWQAAKKALACSWDEVQRYQPVVVKDETASCVDLARP